LPRSCSLCLCLGESLTARLTATDTTQWFERGDWWGGGCTRGCTHEWCMALLNPDSTPFKSTINSNTEILRVERFQPKSLRKIVDAPWYVLNTVIRRDLQIPTVKEEIRCYSSQYSAHLSAHPSDPIVNSIELPDNRRLRRHLPNDLPTRFLV
jgi:hypothetical protein